MSWFAAELSSLLLLWLRPRDNDREVADDDVPMSTLECDRLRTTAARLSELFCAVYHKANSAFHPHGVDKWVVSFISWCYNCSLSRGAPCELRINAGVVWLWSTPERIRGEVLTTMRYTNRRLPSLPCPEHYMKVEWARVKLVTSQVAHSQWVWLLTDKVLDIVGADVPHVKHHQNTQMVIVTVIMWISGQKKLTHVTWCSKTQHFAGRHIFKGWRSLASCQRLQLYFCFINLAVTYTEQLYKQNWQLYNNKYSNNINNNNRFTTLWSRITRVSKCSHKGETYWNNHCFFMSQMSFLSVSFLPLNL